MLSLSKFENDHKYLYKYFILYRLYMLVNTYQLQESVQSDHALKRIMKANVVDLFVVHANLTIQEILK